MEVYGIIMEINPFHNGHLYFLKKAREIAGTNPLVCVISTNIVQRGEISVLSKDIKTKLLLENGVDIVCELPAVLANQGGEYFAQHAINILRQFNVSNLIFGSETGDLDLIIKHAYSLSYAPFNNGIHSNLNSLTSNDILGISYVRAARFFNLDFKFHLVKRISNNYNDTSIENSIASATAIRSNIANHELIKNSLPTTSLENICYVNHHLLFDLFKVNLFNAIDNKLNIFLSESGQLLNKIASVLKKHDPQSLEQLVELCKDKNNSKYKFNRIIINTILLITPFDYHQVDYLRILGFNTKHSKLLPANSFTSLASQNNIIADIEYRASTLFSIVTSNNDFNEFNKRPIIFKEKNEL